MKNPLACTVEFAAVQASVEYGAARDLLQKNDTFIVILKDVQQVENVRKQTGGANRPRLLMVICRRQWLTGDLSSGPIRAGPRHFLHPGSAGQAPG
jgi:hypothetical protein